LLEQFGGPQGELTAACRYFTQAVGAHPRAAETCCSISRLELSHLEIIGSIVAMLNKGAKSQLAESVEQGGGAISLAHRRLLDRAEVGGISKYRCRDRFQQTMKRCAVFSLGSSHSLLHRGADTSTSFSTRHLKQ
jgi:hypothetical protein